MQEVIRLRPREADAHSFLAYNRLMAGRFVDAQVCAAKAISIDPDHAQSWEIMGSSLHHQKLTKMAIPAFERSIRLNPDRLDAYANLCAIYSHRGRHAKANLMGEEFLRRYPTGQPGLTVVVQGNLGWSFCETKQWAQAEHANRSVLALAPDDCCAMVNLAHALFELGSPDEARTLCRKAISLGTYKPSMEEARKFLAKYAS